MREADGIKAPRLRGINQMLLIALAALLCSCSSEPDVGDEGARDPDLPSSTVQAEGIEATVTASAREIEVGQPLQVELTVHADAKFEVLLPNFEKELGPFEVRSSSRVPAIPVEDKRKLQMQLELMTFEQGALEVPSLMVTYRDPSNAAVGPLALATAPLSIAVTTVVGESAQPDSYRDIKAVAEMPRAFPWMPLFIGGGVLALMIGIIALFVLVARRKGSERTEPPPLPHEWAERELDRLERDGLIQLRAFEPFYVRLSAIVRGYLERRFSMNAPERTTDEFLREAGRSTALTHKQRDSLGSFLRAADMVKFARFEPAEHDCVQALESARLFVEQTTQSSDAPVTQRETVEVSA